MGALLILQTIFLGIIEGLTEFIPVSSTAHLLLAGALIGIEKGPFLETLAIAIQSGAILAVVWYFWSTIWNHRSLFWKVAIGFIPTAVAGILLYPIISNLFSSHLIIAGALIVGGILLVIIRPVDTESSLSSLSYKEAFLIGLLQIASFIPGVSRAGATLIGGTFLKIPRNIIVPFSFLLAIPTIVGASVVALRHTPSLTQAQWFLIGIGTVVACITAVLSVRFFITLLTKKPLAWFGWYRIAIGLIVLLFFV